MIVKALAKEAQDMPFFIVKPRDIFNEYLGGTEKRIKILFQVLEAHSPCILFLDDAEQMLADRSNENTTRLQLAATSAFSTEMDDLVYQSDDKMIFVIAATKNPEQIDRSLRIKLKNHIEVQMPSLKERKHILKTLTASISHCLSDDDLEEAAESTRCMSTKELKNVVYEAVDRAFTRTIRSTHFKLCVNNAGFMEACKPYEYGAIEIKCSQIPYGRVQLKDVTHEDMLMSFKMFK